MKNFFRKIAKGLYVAAALATIAGTFAVFAPKWVEASPVGAWIYHFFYAHNAFVDGVETLGPWPNSNFSNTLTATPVESVSAATSIPVTASYEILNETGTITLQALPTFATYYTNVQTGGNVNFENGAHLIVVSTSAIPVTFQDNSILAGSDLFLSSQTVVLEGPGAPATNLSAAAPIRSTLEFRFNSNLGGWQQR